jgi:hypothetical protein
VRQSLGSHHTDPSLHPLLSRRLCPKPVRSVAAPAAPSLRAAPQAASAPGGLPAAGPAVGIARGRAPPLQGPVSAPRVAVATAAPIAVAAAAIGFGRAAAIVVVAATAIGWRGAPGRTGAARVPVALEGVAIGASAWVIRVVAVAPPVAVAVAVASGRTVVPRAGVAVVAISVLSGRGRKIAGVAGAQVVAARIAVAGRVALLPRAQVGVAARGRRLPARRARIAVSPPHPRASAARRARRRGPLGRRPGPTRRPALQGHRGPGGPQVEIPHVAAIVGGPALGRGSPRAAAASPARPTQASRATAAAGQRRPAPAALECRLGGLGHLDGLTIQGLAVHVAGGGLGVCGALEGDEREAPGLGRFSVFHQEHLGDATILAKRRLEGFLVGFGVEPPDEELPGTIGFNHVGGGSVGRSVGLSVTAEKRCVRLARLLAEGASYRSGVASQRLEPRRPLAQAERFLRGLRGAPPPAATPAVIGWRPAARSPSAKSVWGPPQFWTLTA